MTNTAQVQPREHETAILDAARDLMLAGGMEAVSMRAVADRVGVSATALYHYFQNKHELVDRVVRSAFERFGAYLEAAAASQPAGSLDRVAALGEAYIRFALENEAYFRVIFSMNLKNPRALEELPGGGGYPILRQCVVDAMESGAMRRGDADSVAHFLWSVVHGIVTLSMTLRLRGCEGCRGSGDDASPLALFQAVRPFLRYGLSAISFRHGTDSGE
jgi:AcrR family transcriptional regulator